MVYKSIRFEEVLIRPCRIFLGDPADLLYPFYLEAGVDKGFTVSGA